MVQVRGPSMAAGGVRLRRGMSGAIRESNVH